MKAVFFDFDGTLTYKSPNIWKEIWKSCGYDTDKNSYFSKLFNMFMSKEITHQEWCDLTCAEFRKAKFSKYELSFLSSGIKLIDGLEVVLKALKGLGFSLHIISGNITPVIKKVLGNYTKYFDTINGNEITFDNNEIISNIIGTNYDFEGKAKFVSEFKAKTNSKAGDLIFVGNGNNDEWVHLSGCKTICINPENAETENKTVWHICKDNVENLTEILPFIQPVKDDDLKL